MVVFSVFTNSDPSCMNGCSLGASTVSRYQLHGWVEAIPMVHPGTDPSCSRPDRKRNDIASKSWSELNGFKGNRIP